MKIQLSDHFTYSRLLRFTLPSIAMMIFTSIYSVVDGIFVSNLVGDTAFAAVNFVMPLLMILGAVGTMLGTGGCALIAMTLGEGNRDRANRLFTFFVAAVFILGVVTGLLGIVFLRPLVQLMSNVSMSLVSMLYNIQLLRLAGEDGVSAYGVIMYVNMIFLAVFIGYSVGVAPVIGYHYGAQNHDELRGLLRRSLVLIGISAVAMFVLSELLARPLSSIFVGYKPELLTLTVRAFTIYSFSFLFAGFAIFGSSFFTALNDGLTSALISFLRTLVFQVAAVLIFPLLWGLDGIWYSIVAAEVMAVVFTVFCLAAKRKKYHY